MERIQWPTSKNLCCEDLDILARNFLFFEGIYQDYGDNGHGVSQCGGVHEMPPIPDEPYEVGMFITNEPGYYE